MKERISFIHAADLHLGSPLKTVGRMSMELQKIIRQAGYLALQRIVDAALRYEVDFVVISGDVYDHEAHSVYANQFFVNQMDRLKEANTPVLVIYGNHDPLKSKVAFFDLPTNVHEFGSEAVGVVEITNSNGQVIARVLGQSYRNPSEGRKMYHAYSPPNHDVFNVGLLHTSLNPLATSYVPCSVEDLKQKHGIDYWALGHIHQTSLLNTYNPVIAYPGIPQGRDRGEPGVGGCFLVTVNPGVPVDVRFIPTASVVWLTIEVPINDSVINVDDLEELIIFQSHGYPRQGGQRFSLCQ